MKPFTLDISNEINRILTDYENAVTLTGQRYAVAHKDFTKNLKNGQYTADYCRELFRTDVDGYMREFYDVASELDNQLTKAIASAKSSAEEGLTVTDDSAAYYSRLNYAHTIVKDEGKTIDDQAAFDAIGDFRHDLKQMGRFFRMIDRQIDDRRKLVSFQDTTLDVLPSGPEHAEAVDTFGMGGPGFPKTFAYLNHCDKVFAVLDEMAAFTPGLLTHKLTEKNEWYVVGTGNDNTIYAPQIPLTPAMKMAQLHSLATKVETMLKIMEKIGDFE